MKNDVKKPPNAKMCSRSPLKITDMRQLSKCYETSPVGLWISEEIHPCFFEQLAEQITPQIIQTLQMELSEEFELYCLDRFFVDQDHSFCVFLYLGNKKRAFGNHFWVECMSRLDDINLKKEQLYSFVLCNAQDSRECDLKRFSRTANTENWAKELREELRVQESKGHHLLGDASHYPDVVLQCRFQQELNDKVKNALFSCVMTFINRWNEENKDKIHTAFLTEDADEYTVCVFVDFGNCDPIALKELMNHLSVSISGLIVRF